MEFAIEKPPMRCYLGEIPQKESADCCLPVNKIPICMEQPDVVGVGLFFLPLAVC